MGLFVGLFCAVGDSNAQSIGAGSSPGRASYRPQSDWNNGPFYTVNHVNPYSPRPSVSNDLIESQPGLPPYSNGPRGAYANYTPGQGRLSPYAEGFSPYSGYSKWYLKTYGVNPTRENVERARAAFFRSAPRPPAGVLPALPPAVNGRARTQKSAIRAKVVERPRPAAKPGAAARAPQTPIYRSGITGP